MIEYLGLICLTVISVNATPILMLRDKLGLLDMKDSNSQFKNRIIELLSCAMCLGFWIGLLGLIYLGENIVFSILGGSIVGVFAELTNKLLRK